MPQLALPSSPRPVKATGTVEPQLGRDGSRIIPMLIGTPKPLDSSLNVANGAPNPHVILTWDCRGSFVTRPRRVTRVAEKQLDKPLYTQSTSRFIDNQSHALGRAGDARR